MVRAKCSRATSSTTTSRSTRRGCRGRPIEPSFHSHCATGCTSLARDAFLAIGGEGFARVDFLLAGETLYLNEINTIPGFTPISLFPAVCEADGRTFGDVCQQILALALEREPHRPRRVRVRADLP